MRGWPPVGSVLAIPPELAAVLAIAVLIALVQVWFMAPAVGARIGRRPRTIRALSVVSAVALGIGSALVADAPSIGPGSTWGGDDPRLVAIVPVDGVDEVFVYAYERHAEIRQMISIWNTGPVPIIVLGLGAIRSPYVESVTLRLAPGGPTLDGVLLRMGAAGQRWFSEPFAPFELEPGQQTNAALAVRLTDCPAIRPVATLAPGIAMPSEAPTGTGFTVLDTLLVHYSALGIEREAPVHVQAGISVAAADGTLSCGN